MTQYTAEEVGEMLNITGAGVRRIIRDYNLVDGKKIVKKTWCYIISDKGIEEIRKHTREAKEK